MTSVCFFVKVWKRCHFILHLADCMFTSRPRWKNLPSLLAHMYDAKTALGEGDWVHSRIGFPNFIKYFAFCTEHVVTKVNL